MAYRRVAKTLDLRNSTLLPVVRSKISNVRKIGIRKACRFVLIVSLAVLFYSFSCSPPVKRNPFAYSKHQDLAQVSRFDTPQDKSRTNGATYSWQVCRGGDENCCRKTGKPSWASHRITTAQFPHVSQLQLVALYPLSEGDVVSDSLRFNHVWEENITGMIQTELSKLEGDSVLFDIGANIGWYTLAAAYAGRRAIAVEPFAGNIDYLHHSLCLAPPDVRSRVIVVHSGLGLRDNEVCELWHQEKGNEGNFRTVCNEKTFDQSLKYTKFGTVHLNKLDTLVALGTIPIHPKDKVVVKIDVEGFEPFVMMGGLRFLREIQPRFVHSEFSPAMIRTAAKSMGWPKEKALNLPDFYLQSMKQLGYSRKYLDNKTEIRNIAFELISESKP